MAVARTLNARIGKVSLGYFYDKKFLSAEINLYTRDKHINSQGWSFGGYTFDAPPVGDSLEREGVAFGMQFIGKVLRTLDVDRWEDLPETRLRIKVNSPTVGQRKKVYAIGHYLEDNWFYPNDLIAKMQSSQD